MNRTERGATCRVVALWLPLGLLCACTPHLGEPGLGYDFTIVNHASSNLTIVGRPQEPGAPTPTSGPYDDQIKVAAGATGGLRIGLSPGNCVHELFLATDLTGEVIATEASPVCEKTDGSGATWTITAP